jgi:hypothetical protein
MLIFTIAAQSPAEISHFQTQEAATPMPSSVETESASITPSVTLTLTTTPFPDWAMTSKDTNGLLASGILILLIIIIGTLTALTKNIPLPPKKE